MAIYGLMHACSSGLGEIMPSNHGPWLSLTLVGLLTASAASEQQPKPQARPAGTVVAMVNGQPIREVRGAPAHSMSRVWFTDGKSRRGDVSLHAEHEHFEEQRLDALHDFIDRILIDQYVVAQDVMAEAKEIDEKLAEFKDRLGSSKLDYQEWLTSLEMTGEELRGNFAAQVRLGKFLDRQTTEKALRDLFEQHPDWFDGTRVSFRCIQKFAPSIDPQGIEETRSQLLAIRKEIENAAQASVAKLPPDTAPEVRERTHDAALAQSFAAKAGFQEYSNPGWMMTFQDGLEDLTMMQTIFMLKPMQISEVVQVRRSLLLFLVTARKPGQAGVKSDDIDAELKEEVRMVFQDLRYESMVKEMRAKARIVILGR
jgi:hypothetical protein